MNLDLTLLTNDFFSFGDDNNVIKFILPKADVIVDDAYFDNFDSLNALSK